MMPDVPTPLERSQAAACHCLIRAASGFLPLTILAAWFTDNSVVFAPLVSVCFLGLGWAVQSADGPQARLGTAFALIGQSIALTAAFTGHPWQVDMHMTFFAAMAALVLLVDQKVILAGAGLVVLHHLSLSLVLPGLIYPSADSLANVARTLVHGAVVALESAALIMAVNVRQRLQSQAAERETALSVARERADDMLRRANEARAQAEAHSSKADQLHHEADAARLRIISESQRAETAAAAARDAAAADTTRRTAAQKDQTLVVSHLRNALGRLSDGDLSVKIDVAFPADYEDLRRDFNTAIHKLGAAMAQVAEVSSHIRVGAKSISAAAGDLSSRTERQAATLEQTSAAMTDFTTSVRAAATIAAGAEASTLRARTEAKGGGAVVDKAIQSMQRIAESSQKIARINAVIDEIAFQTNLLALNAGVEAARAGEAGRGFAVVASEVRALSQRCSDAAKEITALVQEAGAHVRDGVDLVGKTGSALTLITESVAAAAEQVAAIARTASDQSQSLTEISAAIVDLDRVTQQNASMFEETTAACQSLDKATVGMIDMVSHFVTATTRPARSTSRSARTA